MKYYLTLVFTLCLIMINNSSLYAQRKLPEIPAQVTRYINANFPTFGIATLANYHEDMTKGFYQHKEVNYPCFISGDFDGNGLTDYVLFLIDTASDCTQAVVLLGTKTSYRYWVLAENLYGGETEDGTVLLQYTLEIQKPGKLYGLSNQPLILKNPGITLVKIMASSKVFYWENGRFKIRWTGT